MINSPFPTFDELFECIGEAGQRLCEINASEGASGNISVYMGWNVDPGSRFNHKETIPLPLSVPELAGKTFIVTGSGRRLREVYKNPDANLGLVVVNPDGINGTLFVSDKCRFKNLTSEWISHLAIHRDQISKTATNFHAVVHGQPLYLTFLSHIPSYQDEGVLNRRLLRWEPETIINLPNGIGYIPFQVPSSEKLMLGTAPSLKDHSLVIWAKHGVVARSDVSVKHASDLIEYMETAAHYEYLNIGAGQPAEGLTVDEIREIAGVFKIKQNIY